MNSWLGLAPPATRVLGRLRGGGLAGRERVELLLQGVELAIQRLDLIGRDRGVGGTLRAEGLGEAQRLLTGAHALLHHALQLLPVTAGLLAELAQQARALLATDAALLHQAAQSLLGLLLAPPDHAEE